MKKALILGTMLALGLQFLPAQKLITKTAHVWFYSHTPVEDIEAHNHQALSVVNVESGELAFSMLMKSFEFEKALMQEHFNEKYVESTQYPRATFKGTITNPEAVNLNKAGSYPAKVKGTMTIHGKTQPMLVEGEIIVSDSEVKVNAEFEIKPVDYDIKIPGVVQDKIAESIQVTVDATYPR